MAMSSLSFSLTVRTFMCICHHEPFSQTLGLQFQLVCQSTGELIILPSVVISEGGILDELQFQISGKEECENMLVFPLVHSFIHSFILCVCKREREEM